MKREEKEQQRQRAEEVERLKKEITHLQEEMAATLEEFSDQTEDDLIDYYTYYYKAAAIKHGYLLKKLKKIYYLDENRYVI